MPLVYSIVTTCKGRLQHLQRSHPDPLTAASRSVAGEDDTPYHFVARDDPIHEEGR